MWLFKEYFVIIICLLFNKVNGFSYEEEVENSTDFTLDFYKNHFDVSSNTVLSPFSIRIFLSLIYQNAEGQTEIELRDKIHFASGKRDRFKLQQLNLTSIRENPNVKILNKIYLTSSKTLKAEFYTDLKEYECTVEQIDFSNKTEVVERVNNWAKENTNGLITNLLNPKMLNESSQLLLVNTLLFKAKWLKPFNSLSTYYDRFRGFNEIDENIEFMVDSGNFDVGSLYYIKSDIIQLNYEDSSGFKFWLILPNEGEYLSNVVSKLSSSVIGEIAKTFVTESIRLSIPIFEIESQINNKNVLEDLGVNSLFVKNELDILTEGKMRVTDAVHKTKITVNTDGTERATMLNKADEQRIYTEIKVDHPFVFMVLTAVTNEPVLIGHVVNMGVK